MKECNKCKLEKEFSEFTKCSKIKDGYYGTCKECRYGHKPYKPQLEGLKICTLCKKEKDISFFPKAWKSNSYMSECKNCRNKRTDKYRANQDKEYKVKRNRRKRLREKYDMSPDDYNKMYILQEGKCKICKDPYDKLYIDHCHTTGLIRGLLCGGCNTGLGMFKDNSNYLSSAIEYLKLSNTDKS